MTTPKLAILTPTMPEREGKLKRLSDRLENQLDRPDVNWIVLSSPKGTPTTGEKRNQLVKMADDWGADYAVFVDDDDLVAPNYVDLIMDAISEWPDVVGIIGEITNGKVVNRFTHKLGMPYTEMKRGRTVEYLRPPNHLNPMRIEFLKAFPFKDLIYAEDYTFCMAVHNAGVLQSEVMIEQVIYFYTPNANQ